jgi:hypothetical protein
MEDNTPMVTHDLVGTPTADFTDEVMDAQYIYRSPICVPPCSLSVGTLNVNGALYHPEHSTIDTLYHLFNATDISILGLTDARISSLLIDSTKSLLRRFLPRGTAIVPFCTAKSSSASHRNTTMGGQLLLINRQWEKWAGHHRSDPSGLALVVGLRITYRRTVLSIIQVIVPPKSPGPHTMWQRLTTYLHKTRSNLRPDDYVIHAAERWAAADKLAGRTILIMRDFN